jgi:hypothetical protein
MKKSLILPLAGLLGLPIVSGALRSACAHASRTAAPVRAVHRPVAPNVGWHPHVPGPRFNSSYNWSGYATLGGGVTDISGSWTVPQALPSGCTNGYSATWVGIDGYNSNTVEQCGTEQDNLNGSERYYAWYEMYPKGSAVLPYPVARGDTITASVHYGGSNVFTLRMTSSQGWTFTTNQQLKRAQRNSAEWIEEAPWSGGILPLADFNSVGFSGCTSNIGGPATSIDMIGQSTGNTLAKTGGTSGGGFSIQWLNCR